MYIKKMVCKIEDKNLIEKNNSFISFRDWRNVKSLNCKMIKKNHVTNQNFLNLAEKFELSNESDLDSNYVLLFENKAMKTLKAYDEDFCLNLGYLKNLNLLEIGFDSSNEGKQRQLQNIISSLPDHVTVKYNDKLILSLEVCSKASDDMWERSNSNNSLPLSCPADIGKPKFGFPFITYSYRSNNFDDFEKHKTRIWDFDLLFNRRQVHRRLREKLY